MQTKALTRLDLNQGELGRAGFEPATHGFSIRAQDGVSDESATGCELVDACLADQLADGGAGAVEIDADLARIIAAWPGLSRDVQCHILEALGNQDRS